MPRRKDQQEKSIDELKKNLRRPFSSKAERTYGHPNDGEDGTEELARFEQRIYRLPEVVQITGMSKPSIYRWIRENKFPAPSLIGGPGTRAKGWWGAVLAAWYAGLSH